MPSCFLNGGPGCQISVFSGVLQVAVVKVKSSDKVFAMKILNKWEMLKRAEVQALLSLSSQNELVW